MNTFIRMLAIAAALAPATLGAETDNDWQTMLINDLEFIRDTINSQHPGAANADDPAFSRWVAQGSTQAIEDLDKVRSYGGYRAVLNRYIAGFRDGHMNLQLNLHYEVAKWPGFLVEWREGAFRVYHVEPGLNHPEPGDVLLGCEGQDAESLYAERVHAFRGLGIPADRNRHAWQLTVNHVNPLIEDPQTCRFSGPEGEYSTELQWSWPDEGYIAQFPAPSRAGQRGEMGMEEQPDGSLWLTLPTFSPNDEQTARLKPLLASLSDHRDAPYVVVDVRGNTGGSSYWAEAFVRGLFGDEFWDAINTDDGSYAVHRVSQENIEHFEQLLPRLAASSGEDSDFYQYFAALVTGLKTASEQGQTLYEHHWDNGDPDNSAPTTIEAAYPGQVILLTDSVCASACLDFADVMMKLPRLTHVGQPTSADTIYMEVRSVALPSRNGRLHFATKFYRGRARGNNEYYSPNPEWTGNIADTEALQAWIAGMRP